MSAPEQQASPALGTPWVPLWPLSPMSYATSLPAGPTNGQEAVLVDSLTAPTYQWRFRYNASSTSPYKWECIGATAPLSAYVDPSEALPGAWGDPATPGPAVTPPRAGDYMVTIASLVSSASVGSQTLVGYAHASITPADTNEEVIESANGWQMTVERTARKNGLTATPITMKYRSPGTGNASRRRISIIPVRVS